VFLVVKYQKRKDESYNSNILLTNGKVKYCLAKNMLNSDFIIMCIPYIWVICAEHINLAWPCTKISTQKCVFFLNYRGTKIRCSMSLSMWRIFSGDFPCIVPKVPDRIFPHNDCNWHSDRSEPTSSTVSLFFFSNVTIDYKESALLVERTAYSNYTSL
jgi:hypothetical protein